MRMQNLMNAVRRDFFAALSCFFLFAAVISFGVSLAIGYGLMVGLWFIFGAAVVLAVFRIAYLHGG